MMKTIKQIADEIGVSKQAVQKRIAREPLRTSLQPYISTVDSTKRVSIDGENLIKSSYLKQSIDKPSIDVCIDKPTTIDNQVYSILHETITALQKQLEVKDEQIKDLTTTILEQAESIKEQAQSINFERKNSFAGTLIDSQKQIMEGKKRGFISRIFSKGESNV